MNFISRSFFVYCITESCRYTKGVWSECDSKSNIRTRTLTLKKGDPSGCEPVKTIQKKCKRGDCCNGTNSIIWFVLDCMQ